MVYGDVRRKRIVENNKRMNVIKIRCRIAWEVIQREDRGIIRNNKLVVFAPNANPVVIPAMQQNKERVYNFFVVIIRWPTRRRERRKNTNMVSVVEKWASRMAQGEKARKNAARMPTFGEKNRRPTR